MNTIHTFELCAGLTIAGYQLCRNKFFAHAKRTRLPNLCYEHKSKVTYNYWLHQGVIIYLTKNAKNHDFATIYFRINPSMMVYNTDWQSLLSTLPRPTDHTFSPDSLYSFDLKNNQRVLRGIKVILSQLPVNIALDALCLVRVDLCEDFSVPDNKTLCSYLRVANKGFHHPKWTEDSFGDIRDNHSIRRKSKRYQLTIYDKTYQMEQRFADLPFDTTKSILRVELALQKRGINHMVKKYEIDCSVWYEVLFGLLQNSSEILVDMLDKLLSPGNYYTLSEAKKIIMDSDYREDRKAALIDFLTGVNRCSIVSKYELMHENGSKLRVKQLAALGINIITLDARGKIPVLPSVQTLIRHPQSHLFAV